jgi:hypothetical protein
MDAGADDMLVSRIMAASVTLEIEVCGDLRCWIRRSASAGARRCVAVTAGETTGNCLKWSRDISIGKMYVARFVAQSITRGEEGAISIVLFVLKSTVNKVPRSSSRYFHLF